MDNRTAFAIQIHRGAMELYIHADLNYTMAQSIDKSMEAMMEVFSREIDPVSNFRGRYVRNNNPPTVEEARAIQKDYGSNEKG